MYFRPPYEKGHPNARVKDFHPVIMENLEVRWAFLRKVYLMLTAEMSLMVLVAYIVVFNPPVANFFVSTPVGFGLYISSLILPFIVLCVLYFYHRYQPFNHYLLGVFVVAVSFAVGLTCAFTNGDIILEYVILTYVITISLTLYTVKRRHFFQFDFAEVVSMANQLYLFFSRLTDFPLGRPSLMMYGVPASLIYCGYIIYDTNNNLMERYTREEYVWATVALNVVDIFNLFFNLFLYIVNLLWASYSSQIAVAITQR
ncbi:BI1-like protein [Carex littledalei]|uniref:BI1-like protein n=1 Tax=Carex littledalei TaxID=544730 RepID=A0A833RIA6_9POAL|nr:BI1-like protein [Carex littledalei]